MEPTLSMPSSLSISSPFKRRSPSGSKGSNDCWRAEPMLPLNSLLLELALLSAIFNVELRWRLVDCILENMPSWSVPPNGATEPKEKIGIKQSECSRPATMLSSRSSPLTTLHLSQ